MATTLKYVIQTQIELNFSYIPFIKDGGLFVPTNEEFQMGDDVLVDVQLPGQLEMKQIMGRVVWITPANSLYQICPGIGIQFIGDDAKAIHDLIKASLDNTLEIGCYAYGVANAPENL